MSDEEIRREYRLAKYPSKQIAILADENGCSRQTIRNILKAGGIELTRGAGESTAGAEPKAKIAAAAAPPCNEGEEDNMNMKEAVPTAEPEWPPLPPAKPEAAADFDDLGPSSLPDVQDLPAGPRTVDMPYIPEAPRPALELRYFLSGRQFSELWFILGKLQGVLDASAAEGKPGEVMKDAVDELEGLLREIGD